MKRTTIFVITLLIILSKTFSQGDSLQTAQKALPLAATSVEVRGVNSNVQLLWTVSGNEDAKNFEIERADNGGDFRKIGGKLSSSHYGTASYEFVDAMPKKNIAFSYRIKIVAKDGSSTYSDLQTIKINDDIIRCRLKQNPVRTTIDVEVISSDAGNIQLSVYTAYGQKISSEAAKLAKGINNFSIASQNLLPGIHRLVLETGSERKLISFLKE